MAMELESYPRFTSPSHDSSGRQSALRRLVCDFPELNPPEVLLEDDVRVGECFEMQGSYGQIGISLPEPVHISSVSLEHVSPSMVSSGRARQAPKEVEVWALLERGAVVDSRWLARPAHSFHISSSHFPPMQLPKPCSYGLLSCNSTSLECPSVSDSPSQRVPTLAPDT
ncbi:hypothetical protein HGRIS_001181 [Hohenbuehelia grisea]|uniref:SUN domain-containing protein n=1 Tax=Hohenbuehelia grisea TaxID=104357 RepID=A0ABR3JNJ0_9AGAR